eukprot:3582729-Amphidinium_carterae.1
MWESRLALWPSCRQDHQNHRVASSLQCVRVHLAPLACIYRLAVLTPHRSREVIDPETCFELYNRSVCDDQKGASNHWAVQPL